VLVVPSRLVHLAAGAFLYKEKAGFRSPDLVLGVFWMVFSGFCLTRSLSFSLGGLGWFTRFNQLVRTWL
jgi:hypothetical protein